eukprot:7091149-Prorocentrum_lima.AAC.1
MAHPPPEGSDTICDDAAACGDVDLGAAACGDVDHGVPPPDTGSAVFTAAQHHPRADGRVLNFDSVAASVAAWSARSAPAAPSAQR